MCWGSTGTQRAHTEPTKQKRKKIIRSSQSARNNSAIVPAKSSSDNERARALPLTHNIAVSIEYVSKREQAKSYRQPCLVIFTQCLCCTDTRHNGIIVYDTYERFYYFNFLFGFSGSVFFLLLLLWFLRGALFERCCWFLWAQLVSVWSVCIFMRSLFASKQAKCLLNYIFGICVFAQIREFMFDF